MRYKTSYPFTSFGCIIVIVRGQIDVFVDAIQQPQKELQGVVLGITTELRSKLGHDSLQREITKLHSCSTITRFFFFEVIDREQKHFHCIPVGSVIQILGSVFTNVSICNFCCFYRFNCVF